MQAAKPEYVEHERYFSLRIGISVKDLEQLIEWCAKREYTIIELSGLPGTLAQFRKSIIAQIGAVYPSAHSSFMGVPLRDRAADAKPQTTDDEVLLVIKTRVKLDVDSGGVF